jgi:hypothetical protein
MADRKVYVNVTVRLIIRANEGVNVNAVLDDDMTYAFDLNNDGVTLEDTTILSYEITDIK